MDLEDDNTILGEKFKEKENDCKALEDESN